jgi:hypothetical protein
MKPEYSSLGNIPSSVISYQSLYLHYQSLYLHYQSLYLLESLPIPLFETEGRRELATHDWRTTGRVVYYESIKRELQSSWSKKKTKSIFQKIFVMTLAQEHCPSSSGLDETRKFLLMTEVRPSDARLIYPPYHFPFTSAYSQRLFISLEMKFVRSSRNLWSGQLTIFGRCCEMGLYN